MADYRALTLTGMRAAALIGILPGAIVAAAYLLVLTRELGRHWEARTAVVLGMAVWGVLGVVELWHEYVRGWRNNAVEAATRPVSPRGVLCVWALILLAVAGWKVDEHPWLAAFLALVALYSFGRAFGILKYAGRSLEASTPATAARPARSARARGGGRSPARRSRAVRAVAKR